jgi:transcriptional regulator with XRE-family HTH domain
MTHNTESLKKQIEKIDRKLVNKEEIARRLGVSGAYVNYLLSGKRKNDRLLAKIIEIIKNAA